MGVKVTVGVWVVVEAGISVGVEVAGLRKSNALLKLDTPHNTPTQLRVRHSTTKQPTNHQIHLSQPPLDRCGGS